jgi:hypothetical protein
MVQQRRFRAVAAVLAGTILMAGCAAAPARRTAFVEPAPEPECADPVGGPASPPSWSQRLVDVSLGVLSGAAEGASQGFRTGFNSGRAAWIGAAAGAGIGLMIGLVSGAVKGREALSPYRSADPACEPWGAPAEGTLAQADDRR